MKILSKQIVFLFKSILVMRDRNQEFKEDLDFLYQYTLDKNLNIQGLMCIPPANQDPTPIFKK